MEVWITLNASSMWATRHATNFQPSSPALHQVDTLALCQRWSSIARDAYDTGKVKMSQPTHCYGRGRLQIMLTSSGSSTAESKLVIPMVAVILAGAVDAFHGSVDSQDEQDFFDYLMRESADYFDIFDIHLYGDL